MKIQEYGIKFTQHCRYDPHMVFDYMSQMNKFIYGVFNFLKTKCRITMLLEYMNTARIMAHAQ